MSNAIRDCALKGNLTMYYLGAGLLLLVLCLISLALKIGKK